MARTLMPNAAGASRREQPAERAGFEPAMELAPHTRLAGECLQPLGHLSRAAGRRATAPSVPATPPTLRRGGVAERSNAAALKAVRGRQVPRGFESLPLRHSSEYEHRP